MFILFNDSFLHTCINNQRCFHCLINDSLFENHKRGGVFIRCNLSVKIYARALFVIILYTYMGSLHLL